MNKIRQCLIASSFFVLLPFTASTAHALSCTTKVDSWSNGYVLTVRVTNDTTTPINGWQLALNFSQTPSVTNSWNAELTTNGNTVTARNINWNGALNSGQSIEFGIQGTHTGGFSAPICSTGTTPVSSAASSLPMSSVSSAIWSSSSAPSSSSAVGQHSLSIRALGTRGTESITLRVGGVDVASWTLGTAMSDYSTRTDLTGEIEVAFTNDDQADADVRVDYISVNGEIRQAEDQTINTGAWGNNQCGGAGGSEWLHCNGHINFGNVTSAPVSSATSSNTASSTPSTIGSGSGGCGSAPRLTSGRHTINVGGMTREYILDVPSNYNMDHPYRLVFGWHWRGGSMNDVVSNGYYGLKSLANNSAIFVAPNRANGTDGWTNDNGRDMAFLRAMLDDLKYKLCVDESRIFSTGWSYGGMMSFAVGREMPEVFRAIAPASGATWTPYVDAGQPVAAWIAHGTNDNVVPYSAGTEARDLYRTTNRCSNTTVSISSNCVEYQNCSAGKPVVFCSWNGGHSIPTFHGQEVWKFFSRF